MATQGKHAAAWRDYVSETKEYETLSERLEAAERILGKRAWDLRDRKNPLFIDLDVTEEEYGFHLSLLRDALSTEQFIPQNVEYLYDQVPLVFLSSLVHHALTSNSPDFWPSYLGSLSVRSSDVLRSIIQRNLEPLLRRKSLEGFEHTELTNRYVDKIKLHAGIPAGDLRPLLERIQYDLRTDRSWVSAPAEAYASTLVKELQGAKGKAHKLQSVRTLALALPDRMGDLIARLFELAQHGEVEGKLPEAEEFDDTFGLPEPLFLQTLAHLRGEESSPEKGKDSDADIEVPEPKLVLDPETLELKIVIPALLGEPEEEFSPSWTIIVDGARHTIEQERDWSTGGWSESTYVLERPYRELQVVGPGKTDFPMEGASLAKRSYLLFRSDGALYSKQRSLSKVETLILVPEAAQIHLSSGGRVERRGQLAGWPRWVVRSVRGRKSGHLDLNLGREKVSLEVKVSQEAVVDYSEAIIPHLLGSDKRPVLSESPRITIPSGKGSWILRYVHLLKGERILLDEYNVADSLKGTTFDVFDEADDPWVGRFELQVFHNGRLQSTNAFNMAEGLELSLAFANWRDRGRFRSPVSHAKSFCLSSATAVFEEKGGTRLAISRPTVGISRALQSEKVRVASKFDRAQYYLDVTVTPPSMSYSFPEKESSSRRFVQPAAFSFNDLDDIGEFSIQFPEKVYEPQLCLLPMEGERAGKLTMLPLRRGSRANSWTFDMSQFKREMKKSATYLVAAQWNSVSYEGWVRTHERYASDSKIKRKAYKDGRNPAISTIAKISKEPLLKSAIVKDDLLHLTWGRDVKSEVDLRVWNVSDPLAPAVSLVARGSTVKLPEELCDGSSLIVEAKEREFLSQWNPVRPTSKALVVKGLSPLFNPFAKKHGNRWLFEAIPDRSLMGSEMKTLWEIRDRYHAVLDTKPTSSTDGLGALAHTTSSYLQRSPRVSVNTLSESPIEDSKQLSAFIRADLANKSLQVRATAGEIHPVPWVGLLQEMSDVRVLKNYLRALPEKDEFALEELRESQDYIKKTGGEFVFRTMQGLDAPFTLVEKGFITDELLKVFQSNGIKAVLGALPPQERGSHPLASVESYSEALSQLMNNTVRLNQIDGLPHAWAWLQKHENLVGHLGNQDLMKAINTLADLPNSHRKNAQDNWMYAPYVSLVSSLLARAEAHSILHAFGDADLARNTWSSVAEVAPKLAAIDIVLAEAFALGATKSAKKK
ncbi:hypothetical protein [Corynebacterium vitaeruminis]|uniref:hypothetical protein n=1 Tax=Corynebacterium vitaeruminis TaxID=38305 RepID=UPI0023F41542|nr:hypothetical protein [Corynebacterium vitaeruminis]